ncbi:unnamed protein product [Rhizophagus irregularis]|uniref:Uncharacterized protein n=1 Tax=Rhizophagus irregularis TaxID=588596 RepID=A0A915ZCP6_9GLOM|nr:unnamed protein product [Rhizophagus irregularis]CAB5369424.1 unnamed protein product [Rhizophagus irregularis]
MIPLNLLGPSPPFNLLSSINESPYCTYEHLCRFFFRKLLPLVTIKILAKLFLWLELKLSLLTITALFKEDIKYVIVKVLQADHLMTYRNLPAPGTFPELSRNWAVGASHRKLLKSLNMVYSDPYIHLSVADSHINYDFPRMRGNETPSDWKDRIWGTLMEYRKNHLLTDYNKRYLIARKQTYLLYQCNVWFGVNIEI